MGRFLTLFTSAGTGATAGFAIHQVLASKEGESIEKELVVAAPFSAVVIGALIGLVIGRRPMLAFLGALIAAVFLGRRLDGMIPGLPESPGVPVASLIPTSE